MALIHTGKQVVLDSLRHHGVRHIFGNPGTTELPLIDALVDCPQIEYVLCLQEAAAVSMADAYAHASGEVGVANLHVGPGLGNAIGSLYNAWEGGTPLVVTAGQQDSRMLLREPLLAHDLVALAAPVTKWSVEPRSADELAPIMHRALKIAREAPTGPVFVSLPMDLMDRETGDGAWAPSPVHARALPDPDGVAGAARLLLRARAPVILCGDRVAAGGAVGALVALAELLGAAVWQEVLPARVNFPLDHDLYVDRVPNDHGAIARALEGADAVLMVGGDFFEEVWFADGAPFPGGARRLQIDSAPGLVARQHRVDCAIVADPAATLRALARVIAERADAEFQAAARARREAHAARKSEARARQAARAAATPAGGAMSMARLMAETARALPGGASVVAEAITGSLDMLRSFPFREPLDLLASRGGGIGQGLPGAVGFKLAQPERPVLGLSGDGSALYNVQALWTAAHHRIPVVFMILRNGTYRILKLNMNRYRDTVGIGGAEARSNRGYPHLDLDDPAPDFVSLAAGFGLAGRRVEDPAEIGPALEEAFASGEPRLIEAVVDGAIG